MVFTASNEWNHILSQIKTHYIVNLLQLRKPYFKYLSASMKIVAEMTEPYFVKLQFMVIKNIIHIVFFYTNIQYLLSILHSISLYLFSFIYFFSLSFSFSQHLYLVCIFFLLNINFFLFL